MAAVPGDLACNNSIKAVLFDFGGVLAEEGFHNGLVALAREQELDVAAMPKAGMDAVYDSGFVLGKATAAEFWHLLQQRTGLSGDEASLTQRILDGFSIRSGMIELVRKLRNQGLVTGILSDQTHWLDLLNDKYHFYDAFDHVFNSYYLGKGKRDPSLFSDIAAILGMAPGDILFVDDSEGNILRARAVGMQVLHYVDDASIKALMLLGESR